MVCYRNNLNLSHRSLQQPTVDLESKPSEGSSLLELLYVVLVMTVTDPSVDVGEFFQAACTGTLVSKQLVLTASNCINTINYRDPNPGSTTVYQRPNHLFRAVKIFIHPESGARAVQVLLVMIADSASTNYPLLPQKPIKYSNDDLKACVLTGYGKLRKPSLNHFQVIDLNKTKAQMIRCRGSFTDRVCFHLDVMPCAGDMGAALICGDTLVAVYTPKEDPGANPSSCVDRYGTVFTPAASIRLWVQVVQEAPRPDLEWLNNPWYILALSTALLTVTGVIYYMLITLMQYKYHKPALEEAAVPTPVASMTSTVQTTPASTVQPSPASTVHTTPATSVTTIPDNTWFRFWR